MGDMGLENKTITKEMIFEKLGWVFSENIHTKESIWFLPIPNDWNEISFKVLPNPMHKLDDTFKYVVPRLKRTYHGRFPNRVIGKIIEGALDDGVSVSERLCEEFMKLEEEK